MKLGYAFLSLMTVLCLAGTAKCEIIYNLRFDQASLTLNPGETSTLNVYFEESITGLSTHRLDLSGGTNGLIDGGFQAVFSGLGATTTTAGTGNAGFDNLDPIVPGITTTITQSIALNNPVFASDIGGGTYRVQLGTITVTGGNPGDANVLSLANHPVTSITIDDGLGGLLFLVNGANLTLGSVNINVAAVPEPSLGLLGLLAIGSAAWRRRKSTQST